MNFQIEVVFKLFVCPDISSTSELLTSEILYGKGHTIFYWAIKSGDMNTVRCLIEKCKDDSEGLREMLRREMEHEIDSGEFVCNIWAFDFVNLLKDFLQGHEEALKKRDNDKATPLMR